MTRPAFLFEIKASKADNKQHAIAMQVVEAIVRNDLDKAAAKSLVAELLKVPVASELGPSRRRAPGGIVGPRADRLP